MAQNFPTIHTRNKIFIGSYAAFSFTRLIKQFYCRPNDLLNFLDFEIEVRLLIFKKVFQQKFELNFTSPNTR